MPLAANSADWKRPLPRKHEERECGDRHYWNSCHLLTGQ